MAYKGIDVSQWNGNINFNSVKAAGIEFVMIRAGYGKYISQKDPKFETNYKNAKAAGLGVGAYWYSYAYNAADALAEAAVFKKAISGKTFDYPVAFDIEEAKQYNAGTAACDSIIKSFCGAMENAGYYCMLYSYESFLVNRVSANVRAKYDLWVANTSRTPSLTCGIHQYSFTGNVNGISGAVDMNKTNKNYPSIIKTKGKNGYSKTGSTASTNTNSGSTASANTSSTAASTEKLMKFKVNATGLRYRATASLSGKLCGTFTNNQVINVVKGWGCTKDGYVWYKVKIGSKYYYTASKYLKYISG